MGSFFDTNMDVDYWYCAFTYILVQNWFKPCWFALWTLPFGTLSVVPNNGLWYGHCSISIQLVQNPFDLHLSPKSSFCCPTHFCHLNLHKKLTFLWMEPKCKLQALTFNGLNIPNQDSLFQIIGSCKKLSIASQFSKRKSYHAYLSKLNVTLTLDHTI